MSQNANYNKKTFNETEFCKFFVKLCEKFKFFGVELGGFLKFLSLIKVVYHFMLKSANYKRGVFKAKQICAKT